jgi:mannose-6-phosphate isomerase-like protein (cupin superfamily)
MAAMPKEESQYWPEDGRRITMHQSQHVKWDESKHRASYILMGRSGKDSAFKATGVLISSIFVDVPHTKSHNDARPEAYLCALEGDGYSEIGGKRYDWNQGDAIPVPPTYR